MIDIVKTISKIEIAHSLHLVRLLILLAEFGKTQEAIDGLTKMAKLDFLMRYPTLLEKALLAKKKSTKSLQIEDYERICVESAMVRYRFGPWDHRYRAFLNLLVGKDLASISISKGRVDIMPTLTGMELASSFSSIEEFSQYAHRAELVKKNFNLTGSHLTQFIYKTFPEILTLKPNSEIKI